MALPSHSASQPSIFYFRVVLSTYTNANGKSYYSVRTNETLLRLQHLCECDRNWHSITAELQQLPVCCPPDSKVNRSTQLFTWTEDVVMSQTSTYGGGGRAGKRGRERRKARKSWSRTLTSEPAAEQLMRLLLGLAIQKVEVAL